MTKIRLVHTQAKLGAVLVTDIDEGVPREFLDEERKQECYVTYHQNSFEKSAAGVLKVLTDLETPGFIDLVESDKVMLSREQGDIAGLGVKGLVSVIEIPSGALNAPTIISAIQTVSGAFVTITGTNFESYDPDETIVTVAGITVGFSFDGDDIVTDPITGDATGDEVVVTANGQDSNAFVITAA